MTTEPERLLQVGRYSHAELAQVLIDAYYARIHHIAYSILRDIDAADDAVQDTLIKALHKIDQYRVGSSLEGWLITMVVNRSRDILRRRQRRQRWIAAWEGVQALRQPVKTPEKNVMRRETDEQLWEAVSQLNEKHRLPIILRYVHDMPIAQIAEILQIPEGTVHSRLYYACKKLNQILNKEMAP